MDREQVGGDHYRTPQGIPEHWDIAWALDWDFYQYQITKYIWRWKQKGGLPDLKKAQHFLKKYIEVIEGPKDTVVHFPNDQELGAEPGRGYVNQDPDVPSPSGPARPTSADSPPAASAGEGPSKIIQFWSGGRFYTYERRD